MPSETSKKVKKTTEKDEEVNSDKQVCVEASTEPSEAEPKPCDNVDLEEKTGDDLNVGPESSDFGKEMNESESKSNGNDYDDGLNPETETVTVAPDQNDKEVTVTIKVKNDMIASVFVE